MELEGKIDDVVGGASGLVCVGETELETGAFNSEVIVT
jgi:hypothetical protein